VPPSASRSWAIRRLLLQVRSRDGSGSSRFPFCAAPSNSPQRGNRNLIELHKAQLASDRASCPTANQVRLVLHAAAFWLRRPLEATVPQGGAKIAREPTWRRALNKAARQRFNDNVLGWCSRQSPRMQTSTGGRRCPCGRSSNWPRGSGDDCGKPEQQRTPYRAIQ
jgi:hypothetical protein